jgi:hypothetical protein
MDHNRGHGSLTVREAKSAASDAVVKKTLAEARANDAAKTARLRALRLAKEAEGKS